MWKAHLVETLSAVGFVPWIINDALFHNNDNSILLHMHVNDGLIVGNSRDKVVKFIDNLKKSYALKVKESPNQHLGYTLDWQRDKSLLIHQTDFTEKILSDFDMVNSTPVKAPSPLNFHKIIASKTPNLDVKIMQKAVGMLNYLALHTRPDIAFAVNVLAQFASSPTLAHWLIVKHLLCYLFGLTSVGIHFSRSNEDHNLTGWADADYGTLLVSKKSMLGYVICFHNNPISWTTKKQLVVAQSTTEAEFIAINKCAKQLCWMSNLIMFLEISINVPIIYNNNLGAVIITKDSQMNPNTRHIKICFQYIFQLVANKVMKIKQVSMVNMIADILTKPLGKIKLVKSFKQLHLINVRV
jgi:hypothetical protein